MWPRSKVWIRALKASIQTAATKITNIDDLILGLRLSTPPANYYLSYFFFFSHSYRKPTILKRMCFFEPLF